MITKNIDVNGVTTTKQVVHPDWKENLDENDVLVSVTARVAHCVDQAAVDAGRSIGDDLVVITDLTGYDNSFDWVEEKVEDLI
jgi:hypothetical protein